jgi:hypothetical protein
MRGSIPPLQQYAFIFYTDAFSFAFTTKEKSLLGSVGSFLQVPGSNLENPEVSVSVPSKSNNFREQNLKLVKFLVKMYLIIFSLCLLLDKLHG